MFYKIKGENAGECEITVWDIGSYDLEDTLLCGQAFRYELIKSEEHYKEYLTIASGKIIRVGQRKKGELIFYSTDEREFLDFLVPYFSLDRDYKKIKEDILSRTTSDWLRLAADSAEGIAILKQDRWEALFSFIISQNNNIPRIRGIIKKLSAEYGENICLQNGVKTCPLNKTDATPCDEICKSCGVCYSFPTAEAVYKNPEKMQAAKVGFRYKYLLDAAKKVYTGAVNLEKIDELDSFEETCEALMEISGVGLKVASCTALFGFGKLDAFPVDVWMRRAIDTYFDGKLDPKSLGDYAGVAQQYIFHYIRNLENKKES